MKFERSLEKLSERDEIRYDRQMMIHNFGEKGQKKLKSTEALIAGVGGLGSPLSIYLTAAGIGTLNIVDKDKIELSNLNRQILYREKDIGKSKAKSAEKVLKELNEDINIVSNDQKITSETIGEIAAGCDLIVDCMDNYETRYILNKYSLENKIPLFHAAVHGMRGQATTILPEETPCLKCIVPTPPSKEKFPVLGATPGLMACIQAHEVIKHVTGIGASLKNKLLIMTDGTDFEKIEVNKNPTCEACGPK